MPRLCRSTLALILTSMHLTCCHGINPFAADLGRQDVSGKVARAPYMSQFSYFGYFEPNGAIGNADPSGSARAIYFWLPVSSPELGVRFLSGSAGFYKPDARKDVAEAAYAAHNREHTFFDPAIEVQRCLTVLDISEITSPCAQWVGLGQNDDSPEMPANPRGAFTNSLVRVGTHPEDPLKSLTRGLYRVNVQGVKDTDPKGIFLLQLGDPVLLDQVAMARTPDALAKALAAQVKHVPDAPTIGHTGFVAPKEGTVAPLNAAMPESH